MSKDPHAVALGRKGGQARALLPPGELSRIGKLGGQPAKYRLFRGRLQARQGESWTTLDPPYSKAQHAALYRLRRR